MDKALELERLTRLRDCVMQGMKAYQAAACFDDWSQPALLEFLRRRVEDYRQWPPRLEAMDTAIRLARAGKLVVAPVARHSAAANWRPTIAQRRMAQRAEDMFGLPRGTLAERGRMSGHKASAQKAFVIAMRRRWPDVSLNAMGQGLLAGRDHSTVKHAYDTGLQREAMDPEFAAAVRMLLDDTPVEVVVPVEPAALPQGDAARADRGELRRRVLGDPEETGSATPEQAAEENAGLQGFGNIMACSDKLLKALRREHPERCGVAA